MCHVHTDHQQNDSAPSRRMGFRVAYLVLDFLEIALPTTGYFLFQRVESSRSAAVEAPECSQVDCLTQTLALV